MAAGLAALTGLAEKSPGQISPFRYWTGLAPDSGNPNNFYWTNPGNWLGGTLPANDGTSLIDYSGSNGSDPAVCVLGHNWNIGSIAYEGSAATFRITDPSATLTIQSGGINDFSSQFQGIAVTTVTLGSSQTWDVDGWLSVNSGSIQLGGNTLTVAGTGLVGASARIEGSGGIIKNDTGELDFVSTSNNYAGPTIVNAGSLYLYVSPGIAINGSSLVIGDGISGRYPDAVVEERNDQIGDSTPVTINSSGLLEADASDYLNSVTFNGGTIAVDDSNSSILLSLGPVTVNANSQTATIYGFVYQSAAFTWNIAAGTTASGIDLDVLNGVFGPGRITKTGAGTLRLSGASPNFSGGLSVNAGTVLFGNDQAAGTGTLILNGGTIQADGAARSLANAVTLGGTATVSGSLDMTLTGVVSGTGSLTKNGTAFLRLSGSAGNTYSGTTTVNSGIVYLDKNTVSGTGSAIPGALIIGDGVGGADADVVAFLADQDNQISSTSAVTINSSGALYLNDRYETLNAQLTLNGGDIVESGAILTIGPSVFSVASTASSKTATISTGGLQLSGGQFFDVAAGTTPSGIDLDIQSGVINGTIVKIGNGTLRLANANTASLTLDAGTVLLGDNGAAGTGTMALNGGVLQADGGARTLTNTVTLSGTPSISGALDMTLTGGISGSGSLTKNGTGTLKLTAANSYAGGTTVNAGTLAVAYVNNNGPSAVGSHLLTINNGGTVRIDQNNSLGFNGNTPPIVINAGGTLRVVTFASQHILGITLNGGTLASDAPGGSGTTFGTYDLDSNLTAGGSTATSVISAANVALTTPGSTTFTVNAGASSGIDLDVTGTLGAPPGVSNTALTKAGAGVMRLGSANTYSGGTTVSAGTLVAGNGDALADRALTVANGARAQAQAGLAKALTITTLTTSGTGALDLTSNAMVVRGMTAAQVQAKITSGFAAGAWNGPGIDSSTAAADAKGLTAIGWAANSDYGASGFKGVSGLTANDVLVTFTYYGDADLSGNVTLDDFSQFLNGYHSQTAGTNNWLNGDFDYSGTVTLDDFSQFLYGYQSQGAPLGALEDAVGSAADLNASERAMMLAAIEAVPEPMSGGLLAIAAIASAARHGRRASSAPRRNT